MSTDTLPDCPGCGEKADPRCYFRDVMVCDGCWPGNGAFERWRTMLARIIDMRAEAARLTIERDAAITARDDARRDLANAEGDARILAHAYMYNSRPPPDVVTRALAYQAGRPAPADSETTS